MINQPDSGSIFAYALSTKFGAGRSLDSKVILWTSISALMRKHYGKENLSRLAKECEIGPGTAIRLKEQETSIGLDVVDRIAKRFGLKGWQLLVEGFDAEHVPTLQPLSAAEAALYERWKEVAKEFVRQAH